MGPSKHLHDLTSLAEYNAALQNHPILVVYCYERANEACSRVGLAVNALADKRRDVYFCRYDVHQAAKLRAHLEVATVPSVHIFASGGYMFESCEWDSAAAQDDEDAAVAAFVRDVENLVASYGIPPDRAAEAAAAAAQAKGKGPGQGKGRKQKSKR